MNSRKKGVDSSTAAITAGFDQPPVLLSSKENAAIRRQFPQTLKEEHKMNRERELTWTFSCLCNLCNCIFSDRKAVETNKEVNLDLSVKRRKSL